MTASLVLDLHLHSRFSRAVSSSNTILNLYLWGKIKGIQILSASDVTHPLWLQEIETLLVEKNEGIFTLKNTDKLEKEYVQYFHHDSLPPAFILTTELSLIYSEFGKGRRVHVLVFFPNLQVVRQVIKKFTDAGFNLTSDGRPILGLSLRNLCKLLFAIDSRIGIIPAHVWTPWFGVYGSKSGYDSLTQAFGEYEKHIFAVESGLSSDPRMNWQVDELNTRSIVSFSDAHSLPKMGREATVLTKRQNRITNDRLPITKKKNNSLEISPEDITYDTIMNGLKKGKDGVFEIDYTIEFYPEEGKYHHTGHRNCNISFTPEQTKQNGTMCPVCGRELTVGVLHRIEELRQQNEVFVNGDSDGDGVVWQIGTNGSKFVNLVPLLEIIAESYGIGVGSKKVMTSYTKLIESLGPEFEILLTVPIASISRIAGERIAQAVLKVRSRDITIEPGYDGKYGNVTIWGKKNSVASEQLTMI